tara:strand:+ start:2404 stop:3030 length:627 start_codon:yes stop_codon:yes gene_type:complete
MININCLFIYMSNKLTLAQGNAVAQANALAFRTVRRASDEEEKASDEEEKASENEEEADRMGPPLRMSTSFRRMLNSPQRIVERKLAELAMTRLHTDTKGMGGPPLRREQPRDVAPSVAAAPAPAERLAPDGSWTKAIDSAIFNRNIKPFLEADVETVRNLSAVETLTADSYAFNREFLADMTGYNHFSGGAVDRQFNVEGDVGHTNF